jgi:hypothetical protein
LWILRREFKFGTTSKLKLQRVFNLSNTVEMLNVIKFPMVIAVTSKHACYDHVVVVWNSVVIDYELMYTYPLIKDALMQVCGENTNFERISSGYGLFPPKSIRKQWEKPNPTDLSIQEYNQRGCSKIRGYFD